MRHLGGKVPVLPVHMMVDRRRRLHAAALAAQPDWPAIPMASAVEAMADHRAPVATYAAQRRRDRLRRAVARDREAGGALIRRGMRVARI